MPGDAVPIWATDVDEHGLEHMAQRDDGWCTALDRDTMRCTIYAQRPQVCRDFAMGGAGCLIERAEVARRRRAGGRLMTGSDAARPRDFDAIVIGGGAAGLMCALVAGQRGRRVLVIEHANRVGKKILMSGGGRCNFTNLGASPRNFLSANPHYCKSALARYAPADFVAMVERHRIAYHEKELGQLFCDESSKQIVRMLLDECAAGGVRIETSCSVTGVQRRQGRRFPHRHHARRSGRAVAGGGQRRPVDPEHGRERLRLRAGATLRPPRAAHAGRAGAADPERQAPRRARRLSPAWRYRWKRAATGRASATRC